MVIGRVNGLWGCETNKKKAKSKAPHARPGVMWHPKFVGEQILGAEFAVDAIEGGAEVLGRAGVEHGAPE